MAEVLLIALLVILFLAIKHLISGIKKNLYDYDNIRLIGLIIFIGVILVWRSIILITDRLNHYQETFYMFIIDTITDVAVFTMLMFPLAFVTSILVTISNFNLVMKEGKTWRHMLGVIVGGFICISTVLLMLGLSSNLNANPIAAFTAEYLLYIYAIFIAYLECILIGTIIMGIAAAKRIPKFNKDHIIILGCRPRKDGTPTPLLKSRVDRALEFARLQKEATGKDIIFVPSGGQGADEVISEAAAMKNYLTECGIDEKNILIEDRSQSTYENIQFSASLIRKQKYDSQMCFSTSNYHVFRAGTIASDQDICIEGIGAKTKSYFWINAFIREFVATLVSQRKKHLITLGAIALFFLDILIYVFNL